MANSNKKNSGVFGIHHVTAIARNPQRNIDFYSGILGLRLVKLTVNFDDPTTYHLYYGDAVGHPGTILTFFPWSEAPRGYRGTGQVTTVSFQVPKDSLDYWIDRLRRNGVSYVGPSKRFDDEFVSFHDPDGLMLELVSSPGYSNAAGKENAWKESPVEQTHAIRGFHSATLSEEGYERTAELMMGVLGYILVAEDNKEGRFRFEAVNNKKEYDDNDGSLPKIGTTVDILCQPDLSRGYVGIGTVHHIAMRAADDRHQLDLRKQIIEEARLNPTPVVDRTYFHSVYFREPGGILFEIATDPPGFTIDEKPENLGKQLKLPEWFEPARAKLERMLPPVNVPEGKAVASSSSSEKKESSVA